MKKLGILALAVAALAVAAMGSHVAAPQTGKLQVAVENRNPWTNLDLNNDPADFRFALVSDRTGGHRARIFSQAVEQLNLLQPEFVVCVGDLIEGYTEKVDRLGVEWKEFQGYVSRLQMPFFYLPGNHDMANGVEEKLWQEKFGRRYYHFVYRGVLFLLLNSDDPPGKEGGLGAEQIAYAQKALEENKGARWTIVLMHRPLWNDKNTAKNGWLDVEKTLAGRNYTVFCGHVHRYQKFVRNGMNYYQLATTGGASKVRGVSYGEFDHITWITIKKDGPILVNLLLDGIYPENLKKIVTEEPGRADPSQQLPTHPVRGKLMVDGCPAPGAIVVFQGIHAGSKRTIRADGLVEGDGSFQLSTYQAFDGVPAGEYKVTVTWPTPSFDKNGRFGPNQLPAKYADPANSGLQAVVKDGGNEVLFELKKEPASEKKDKDGTK